MNDTSSSTSSAGASPRLARAALYVGATLAVFGAYLHLNGFEAPDTRPIGPPPSALLSEIEPGTPFTPAPATSPSLGTTIITLLAKNSDSTLWIFLIGGAVCIWGLWNLQKLDPNTNPTSEYLRSAYRDGLDPRSLHSDEQYNDFQTSVAERHQRKVLWSLPFWISTLLLLIVNKGTLGNETMLGISDLWLIAITIGVYLVHVFLCWRCPACEAVLPRYDERLICDKCGLPFNAKHTPCSSATATATANEYGS